MKIRLTHDEVIEACANYAAAKTKFIPLEPSIIDSCYFVITNENNVDAIYETVEFEFVA